MRTKVENLIKWLTPGMHIKRWILLLFLGVFILSIGFLGAFSFTFLGKVKRFIIEIIIFIVKGNFYFPSWFTKLIALFLFFLGFFFIFLSLKEIIKSVGVAAIQDKEKSLVDVIYSYRKKKNLPSVVIIGGGTGIQAVLKALKGEMINLSVIITITDSGGSSGRLRDSLNVLPPGDIRNALMTLAEDNALVKNLLSYRFKANAKELAQHNLGNLIIAALTDLTGDFGSALISLADLLGIKGEVMPFSLDPINLWAEFEDGSKVKGEANIPKAENRIKRVYLEPDYAKPFIGALNRIESADLIILGPGSLYTSVIPNLLLPSFSDTLKRTKGKKVYISNIMTEKGETDNFTVKDHIKALNEVVGADFLDYVIVNDDLIPSLLLEKYKSFSQDLVKCDLKDREFKGLKVIRSSLWIDEDGFIRHNPYKLKEIIQKILIKTRGNAFEFFRRDKTRIVQS